MEKLYNWLFHYNHNTNLWAAFSREDYVAYWNGTINSNNIYYHSDFQELIKILNTLTCI